MVKKSSRSKKRSKRQKNTKSSKNIYILFMFIALAALVIFLIYLLKDFNQPATPEDNSQPKGQNCPPQNEPLKTEECKGTGDYSNQIICCNPNECEHTTTPQGLIPKCSQLGCCYSYLIPFYYTNNMGNPGSCRASTQGACTTPPIPAGFLDTDFRLKGAQFYRDKNCAEVPQCTETYGCCIWQFGNSRLSELRNISACPENRIAFIEGKSCPLYCPGGSDLACRGQGKPICSYDKTALATYTCTGLIAESIKICEETIIEDCKGLGCAPHSSDQGVNLGDYCNT